MKSLSDRQAAAKRKLAEAKERAANRRRSTRGDFSAIDIEEQQSEEQQRREERRRKKREAREQRLAARNAERNQQQAERTYDLGSSVAWQSDDIRVKGIRSKLKDARESPQQQRLTEEGQGAVLLTAHLGSPAAMAAKPEAMSQNITVVAHHGNARKLNDALSRLDKGQRLRFLSVDPTSLDSVLAIRERVEQGELLIVAADRLGLGEGSVEAPFLGQPAPFPLAPFSLCSVLRVPVYLVVALYRRPNIYELYCEPFAETLFAKRSERKAVMEGHVRRYAERLEHYCRLAPDNWFNLYDFWQPHDHD